MKERTKRSVRWIGSGLLLTGLLFLLKGCVIEQITDPGTTSSFKLTQHPVTLSDANGQETSVFYDFETLFVDIFELLPIDQYCIEIAAAGEVDILRRAIVPSDSLGQILALPMLFDIGFDPVNNKPIVPGNYEVRIQRFAREPIINVVVPFKVVAGPNPTTPAIIPTDNSGVYNGGTVLTGDDLYASGTGFPPSTDVRLYVVEDKDRHNIGDALTDISGSFETVTTNGAGELPNTLIWAGVSAAAGTALDLIGDLPPFGQFDATDALREARLAGIIVQNPSAATDIITDLAADSEGNFQDFFSGNDIVTTKAIPPQQSLLPSSDAAVYIVNHQALWQADDPLVNITNNNRASHQMPNFECIRLLSGHKPRFPLAENEPPIPPGRYDVIIDVGRNFVYNPGTDILDGGPQIGFTIDGAIPPVRTFLSADSDFISPKASTVIYAKAVRDDDSPIAGVPVTFKITKGTGILSTNSATTNDQGIATTVFSGGVGDGVLIDAELKIAGVTFEHEISIHFKVPLHDQGEIHDQGHNQGGTGN